MKNKSRENDKDFSELVFKQKEQKSETPFTKTNYSGYVPKFFIAYFIILIFFIVEVYEGGVLYSLNQEGIQSTTLFLVYNIGLLSWFLLIYQIHKYLKYISCSKYPISGGKVVVLSLVSGFNFYWFFKWPYEMAQFVNEHSNYKIKFKFIPGFIFIVGFFVGVEHGGFGLVILIGLTNYLWIKVSNIPTPIAMGQY